MICAFGVVRTGCGGGDIQNWKEYLLQAKVPKRTLTDVMPGGEPSWVGCVISVVEVVRSI